MSLNGRIITAHRSSVIGHRGRVAFVRPRPIIRTDWPLACAVPPPSRASQTSSRQAQRARRCLILLAAIRSRNVCNHVAAQGGHPARRDVSQQHLEAASCDHPTTPPLATSPEDRCRCLHAAVLLPPPSQISSARILRRMSAISLFMKIRLCCDASVMKSGSCCLKRWWR